MTDRQSGDRPRIELPSTPELVDAAEQARTVIEGRLANLDPDILVDLSVGLRSPAAAVEAGWNDSFIDRFLDGGKFGDVFINLHGLRAQFQLDDDPRFGGSGRLHG